ncbi:MAG: hypothetical protein LBR64_00180 [Dysgonamonadaceae bacterium]|jgi:mRNA interferase RelE/StbE|nr:hypothetical protein [Dysgonamonadaceae bacterium]
MEVQFTKTFSKQIDDIRNVSLVSKIASVVETVMRAENLSSIANLKKLKGDDSAYRIRIGNYRIGLFIEKGEATFAYFSHRKDIYNKFP